MSGGDWPERFTRAGVAVLIEVGRTEATREGIEELLTRFADHWDAQRSVLMVINPWAKRGCVSHRHTTIASIGRSLYSIFVVPPLNTLAALANDFSHTFTTRPGYRPDECVPVDTRVRDGAGAQPRRRRAWPIHRSAGVPACSPSAYFRTSATCLADLS